MYRSLAMLLTITTLGCGSESDLPEILVVREFTLTSQTGEAFASRSLGGKVWVASFVYTTCADVCPLITNQVANLHRRVTDERVRFISISVDPEIDTPDLLTEYAARYHADDRWTFLTGDPALVRRIVTQNFRVSMGTRESGANDIPHSEELLLIDRGGVLRGSYPTDRGGMDRLARDIDRLLSAEP